MKQLMFVVLVTGILTCSTFASPLSQSSAEEFLPLKINERVITEDGIEISLEVAEPVWAEMQTGTDPVLMTQIISSGRLEVQGYPSVPVASSLFRIPPQSGIVV